MSRDWQKNQVYAACDAADLILEDEAPPLTRDDVRGLIVKVCREQERATPRVVFHDDDDGARLARRAPNGDLEFRPKGLRATTVLHELAHHLIDYRFPDHGIEWVAKYLELLRTYMGDAVASTFFAEFKHRGIHMDAATRVKRVRRVAVNEAGKAKKRKMLLVLDYDGEARWVFGDVTEANADMLVVNGKVYPMKRARYLESASRLETEA